MINLLILPDLFTLYQLPKDHQLSSTEMATWPWYTISKTSSELSLLLPAQVEPTSWQPSEAKKEANWRAFQVDAQMDFGLVGILATIVDPLRDNGVPVYVISTFDTDYVFVKQERHEQAIGILTGTSGITLKSGFSVVDKQ